MKQVRNRGVVWLVALLLGAATALWFWPVQGLGFVNFDDPQYVTNQALVRQGLTWRGARWALTGPHSSNWHPLTTLSHQADVTLFGLNPAGHHWVNLGLHTLNTVLVLALLRTLTGSLWRSALVAALFGWHPMHVESVAWVSERKDVLSTLFFLLTLMVYVRYVRTGPQRAAGDAEGQNPKSKVAYVLALLLFALGLMSKPMLVTLPAVLLLLDVWPLQRLTLNRRAMRLDVLLPLLREKIPFLAFAVAACFVTLDVQSDAGAVREIPLVDRLGRVALSYAGYVMKLLVPVNLAVLYPVPAVLSWWKVSGVAAVLVILTLGAIRAAGRAPAVLTGWFWFVGTLVPVSGVVPVGEQLMADRYTYIPSIGFFMVLIWGGAALRGRFKLPLPVLATGCAVGLVGLGGLTRRQIAIWQDSETLYRHALRVTENNHVVHNNLAAALLERGRTEEAIEQLHASLRCKPAPLPAYQLGLAESLRGNYTNAIAAFRQALALQPDWVDALNDLAWTLATTPDAGLRQPAEAVALAERACAQTTNRVARCLGTLDAAYAANGQFEAAMATALRAQELAQAAGETNLAAFAGERLQLYRHGKPYSEPPLPNTR